MAATRDNGGGVERETMVIPAGSDIADYARRLGWRRTFVRAAYVMANQVLPLSILVCVRLRPDTVNASLLAEGEHLERRFLGADEVDRIAADLDAASLQRVRAAFARGDECHVVLDHGRLANIGFYATRPAPILGDLVVHFAPTHRYMHSALTPASYRGRRLHAVGILSAARDLFARGVPALVGVYEATNYRSMVSALLMGWERCGTLHRVGSGRWMHLGSSPRARALGLHLEAARPEVHE